MKQLLSVLALLATLALALLWARPADALPRECWFERGAMRVICEQCVNGGGTWSPGSDTCRLQAFAR